MESEQIQLFRSRAERERERAHTVGSPGVATACRKLAEQYDAVANAYAKLRPELTTGKRGRA
jgi:malic enzyme